MERRNRIRQRIARLRLGNFVDTRAVGGNVHELRLHFGVSGRELLSRDSERIAVTLPRDERNAWLVDLDRDGKDDIVVHHPSDEGPHRVVVLRAR